MDILIKSIVSGVITGLILLIAKFSSPKLAGAVGGVPIVFAISYIFLTLSTKNPQNAFLVGGIYGAIAAIFFSLVLIWLNVKFVNNIYWNFVIAYILCFLLALGLTYFTSK